MSNPETDTELLEKEYFHLHSEVESFDAKSLTIKAWSVSLASAIAGSSAFVDNNLTILFAAIVSVMFWVIDGAWKTFQDANYRRINEIERYMRGESEKIIPFQISTSWKKSYKEGGVKRLFEVMCWKHVFLPHGAMFILFLIFYLTDAL